MNITTEQPDDLNLLLTISVAPNDYEPAVDKALRETRRKIDIKGFRPGMVPKERVKAMYGKSILADELDKIVRDSLFNYLNEHKINYIVSPFMKEATLDEIVNANKEYMFRFEVGLAPEFELNRHQTVALDYFKAIVDEKMIDDFIETLKVRHGKMIYPETSSVDDIIFGSFTELDENNMVIEGGITGNGTLNIRKVADDTEREKLVGLVIGTEVVLDLQLAFPDAKDRATMLKVTMVKAEEAKPNFLFKVTTMGRMQPAEVGQELFDSFLGPGNASTEEEFRKIIKEIIENDYAHESDHLFSHVVREKLDELYNVNLPDEYLKRWLKNITKEPLTDEALLTEYELVKRDLIWNMIAEKVGNAYEITIEDDEVLNYARHTVAKWYRENGMQNPDDAILDNYAKRLIQDQEKDKSIRRTIFDNRVMYHLMAEFPKNEILLTKEEFRDKFKGHEHH